MSIVTKHVPHVLFFWAGILCFASCAHTLSDEARLALQQTSGEVRQKNSDLQSIDFIQGRPIVRAPDPKEPYQETWIAQQRRKQQLQYTPRLKYQTRATPPEHRKQEQLPVDPIWQTAINDTHDELLAKFEREEEEHRLNVLKKLDEHFSINAATMLDHPQKPQTYSILMDYFQHVRNGKLQLALKNAQTLIAIFPHHPYFYKLAINAAKLSGQKKWAQEMESYLPKTPASTTQSLPATTQTK